jgi:hypothetical protein
MDLRRHGGIGLETFGLALEVRCKNCCTETAYEKSLIFTEGEVVSTEEELNPLFY